MLPPEPFRHSFVAVRNIPYTRRDGTRREGPFSGGVLGRGQLVWTRESGKLRSDSVTAFVEDLGPVSLDPRWLVPADVLKEH